MSNLDFTKEKIIKLFEDYNQVRLDKVSFEYKIYVSSYEDGIAEVIIPIKEEKNAIKMVGDYSTNDEKIYFTSHSDCQEIPLEELWSDYKTYYLREISNLTNEYQEMSLWFKKYIQ